MSDWKRLDTKDSVLLYTLKHGGWHKGNEVMVNDVTIRIENANGSNNDLSKIASMVMDGLRSETPPF